MESPSLFELFDTKGDRVLALEVDGLARFGDPQTSHDAARKITGRTERLILEVFPERDDWTADELCRRLPTVFPATLKSALSRLANHALIGATGATRPSDRGCEMTVYQLASR